MHCASIVLALLAALRAGGYEFSHIFSRFASTSNDSNASTIIVLFKHVYFLPGRETHKILRPLCIEPCILSWRPW